MVSTVLSKVALACKFIELVISCVCIAMYVFAYQLPGNLIVPITYGAFIVLLPGVIIGAIFKHRLPRCIDLLYSLIGLILFLIAGIMALHFHTSDHKPEHEDFGEIKHEGYEDLPSPASPLGVGMGSLAIINVFVFLIDLIVTFKDVNEYEPQ